MKTWKEMVIRPAPGWELVRVADTRGWDYCPECKARRKAAREVEP